MGTFTFYEVMKNSVSMRLLTMKSYIALFKGY